MVTTLASCRDDALPATDDTPVAATPVATTQASTPSLSPAAATEAPAPSPAATAAPTATPAATPSPQPSPEPTRAEDPAADIAAIRAIVVAYGEAFNDWDTESALSMLEPAYRAGEDQLIRQDIERMEQFGVRLDVSEESPPTLNDDGDYETYVTMVTPVDTRRLRMVFRSIDGAWWIVFSGVVVE